MTKTNDEQDTTTLGLLDDLQTAYAHGSVDAYTDALDAYADHLRANGGVPETLTATLCFMGDPMPTDPVADPMPDPTPTRGALLTGEQGRLL